MRWFVFLLLGCPALIWAETPAENVQGGECLAPEFIAIPDGHKASQQEMLTVRREVARIMLATRQYLDCLLASERLLGEQLTPAQEKASIGRYNLAVARLEGLIESFNLQLRAYKQDNPD